MPSYFRLCLILPLVVSSPGMSLIAQTDEDEFTETILRQDRLFWDAYNHCDTEKERQFFTPDVEFYHDKGGITLGVEALIATVKKNLCSNENYRVRREAVAGTVRVFPLRNAGVIYGVVIAGDHSFYVSENGKPERLDGLAKFFHVWLLKDGAWKMARVISYDHQPAPYVNKRKQAIIPAQMLEQYVGKYEGPKTGTAAVTMGEGLLILAAGDKKYVLYPESERVFFSKDRDLTFEFIRRESRKASTLVVRERGEIVEELQAAK